jgi:hypothetical protein
VLSLAICVSETVSEDTVDEGLVAILGASAEDWEVMWSVGHGLGATCNDDIGSTSHDGLGTKDDRLRSGSAHFVDSCCNSGLRKTGANGALPGWVLSEIGGQNVSEEDLLDILWLNLWNTLDGS